MSVTSWHRRRCRCRRCVIFVVVVVVVVIFVVVVVDVIVVVGAVDVVGIKSSHEIRQKCKDTTATEFQKRRRIVFSFQAFSKSLNKLFYVPRGLACTP